jgi:hypothetical protein
MISQEELKQKILNEVKVLLLQYLRFNYDPVKGLEINFQILAGIISEYFLLNFLQTPLTKENVAQYYAGATKVLETLEKEAISTKTRFPRESEFWLDRLRRTRIALAKEQLDQST